MELDSGFLQGGFFPHLVQRFFGGPPDSPYQVTIVSPSQPAKIIYPPNSGGTGQDLLSGDVTVDLLEARPGGPPPLWLRRPQDEGGESRDERIPAAEPGTGMGRDFPQRPMGPRPASLWPGSPADTWRLVVKHRSGSLEAVVAAVRRRNLGVSFGILLLLAVSTVMAYVSTTRARRLAELQIEFVTGVSHELRTPLAVICSAADNLADGIVDAKEPVRHYGALIRSEAARLSRMVQQILLFASGRDKHAGYELRPAQIAEIIHRVLKEAAPMLEAAGCRVEQKIAPDLPLVITDASALAQCLHNLLRNAVKYGGDRQWVGIRVQRTGGARGAEVQVTVEDQGLGIAPEDLDHIFEPFFRGRSATSAQIHGTGLGLSLAKNTVEAMGGRLSVESTPGRGSAFTLRLPALTQAE